MSKILILGGGFGGLKCAKILSSRLSKKDEIILIDKSNCHIYPPALYEVVVGELAPEHISFNFNDIIPKGVKFWQDEVIALTPKNNTLTLSQRGLQTYDYLVLALGAETDFYKIPGVATFSKPLKNLSDAIKLKSHIYQEFIDCRNTLSPNNKMCKLRFIIVGGGPTGVELSGALASYANKLCKKFNISPKELEIILLEASSEILAGFSNEFKNRVKRRLKSLGVKIMTNSPVREEHIKEIIIAKDHMNLPSETIVWTAGIKATSVKDHSIFTTDSKGRIIVNEFLLVPGFKNIFALGDITSFIGNGGRPLPGLAQIAIDQANVVSYNINASINSLHKKKYQPKKWGAIIPVGKYWAALVYGPFHFYGFIGWITRKFVDIRYLYSVLPFSKFLQNLFDYIF